MFWWVILKGKKINIRVLKRDWREEKGKWTEPWFSWIRHLKHHVVQIESKSSKYEKRTREEGYCHIRFIVEMCGNIVLVAGVFSSWTVVLWPWASIQGLKLIQPVGFGLSLIKFRSFFPKVNPRKKENGRIPTFPSSLQIFKKE